MPSPIDLLYQSIFGELPAKAGAAYERLATAALKIARPELSTEHDQRLRGLFSQSLYQIDVCANGGQTIGEAKDYTESGEKVGRPDLQKLVGALTDLPSSQGAFFSATDYTAPAKRYAESSSQMIRKPLELFHLRPVVEGDLDGRILKITFEMHIITPNYELAKFQPNYTDKGFELIQKFHANGTLAAKEPIKIYEIFDERGSISTTIRDLTSMGFAWSEGDKEIATWLLPGRYISVKNHLIPIRGISYSVPKQTDIQKLSIDAEGKAVMLLKSADGQTDKIIRDVDLRNFEF